MRSAKRSMNNMPICMTNRSESISRMAQCEMEYLMMNFMRESAILLRCEVIPIAEIERMERRNEL